MIKFPNYITLFLIFIIDRTLYVMIQYMLVIDKLSVGSEDIQNQMVGIFQLS